jgi:predicted NBD/HSP70 family sugar kinase
MHLTEVFAQLKLRHDGSTAIDTSTLLRAVDGTSARAARIRSTLAEAVCGVLGAIVALADPERIVIGGTWGSNPTILDAVTARFELQPRHAPTQPAQVAGDASLVAARHHACQELRNNILSRPVERR